MREITQASIQYKNRGKINGIKGFSKGAIMRVGKKRMMINHGDSKSSYFKLITPPHE